jgi:hypothetical protein
MTCFDFKFWRDECNGNFWKKKCWVISEKKREIACQIRSGRELGLTGMIDTA